MDAEDVAVRVPKPSRLKVSDRGDAVLGLEFGKVVLLEAHPAAPQLLHLCPHVGDLPRRERVLRVSCGCPLIYLKHRAIATAVDHLTARRRGSRVREAQRIFEEIAGTCEVGGRHHRNYWCIRKHSASFGCWRNTTPSLLFAEHLPASGS